MAHLEAGVRIDTWTVEWLDAVHDASLFSLLAAAIPLAGAARRADEAPSQSVLLLLRGAAAASRPGRGHIAVRPTHHQPPWPGAQFGIASHDDVVALFGEATETALRDDVASAMFSRALTFGHPGRSDEELNVYDDLVTRSGDASEPALREQVAWAMFNRPARPTSSTRRGARRL